MGWVPYPGRAALLPRGQLGAVPETGVGAEIRPRVKPAADDDRSGPSPLSPANGRRIWRNPSASISSGCDFTTDIAAGTFSQGH